MLSVIEVSGVNMGILRNAKSHTPILFTQEDRMSPRFMARFAPNLKGYFARTAAAWRPGNSHHRAFFIQLLVRRAWLIRQAYRSLVIPPSIDADQ
jgi:hypothetical protein